MAGASFAEGEVKILPDTYVRITSATGLPVAAVGGRVAVVGTANRGPIDEPTVLASKAALIQTFGTALAAAVAAYAFDGGASEVLFCRANGASEATATKSVVDDAAAAVGSMSAEPLGPGTDGNTLRFTLRTSVTDATKKEVLVYTRDATSGVLTLRETWTFDKADGDEALGLQNALAESVYMSFTKSGVGSGVLADVTAGAATGNLAGGVNTTTANSDLSASLLAIETYSWEALVVDSVAQDMAALITAYIDRIRSEGKLRYAILAEPTSVAFATRITDVQAHDNRAVVYVGNGIKVGEDEDEVEGASAAAIVAGMAVSTEVDVSLTNTAVPTAVSVIDTLTTSEGEQATAAGMLYFDLNAFGAVAIKYGITTFVNETENLDLGWSKLRRLRTRDAVVTAMVVASERIRGQRLKNNPNGRASLMGAMQGAINEYVRTEALLSGTVVEDPARPASGDSASFLAEILDLDNIERAYVTVGLQYDAFAGNA